MTDGATPEGVLVVDKPRGPTSHDVVARVRRVLGVRRVGHAGTLDPMASGVLACCVGRATRLARWLSACDKEYEGRMRFGFATDTGDAEGSAVGDVVEPALESRRFAEAADRLTGELDQVPPMYSAKKRGGRKLYELARRGEIVERDPVRVRVSRFELDEPAGDEIAFRVTCSAGTYVRVLAVDLGRLVGCPAHLVALRRTAAGPFAIGGAVALDDLDRERATSDLVPTSRVPLPLPAARVDDAGAVSAFAHGRRLTSEWRWVEPPASEPVVGAAVAVRDGRDDRLLGVARFEADASLAPDVVLATSG